jgi:hypothetical protein
VALPATFFNFASFYGFCHIFFVKLPYIVSMENILDKIRRFLAFPAKNQSQLSLLRRNASKITATANDMQRISAFSLLFLLLFFSCDIDHGLGTLDSGINGQIIFINPDKKPDFIDAVRVIAAVKIPPQTLGDVVFTNTSVNLSQQQSAFHIAAPLASYEMVAAVWKEKGKAWNYANILGFYGFDPIHYQVEFLQVKLSKSQPVADDINIYCDWSLIPR